MFSPTVTRADRLTKRTLSPVGRNVLVPIQASAVTRETVDHCRTLPATLWLTSNPMGTAAAQGRAFGFEDFGLTEDCPESHCHRPAAGSAKATGHTGGPGAGRGSPPQRTGQRLLGLTPPGCECAPCRGSRGRHTDCTSVHRTGQLGIAAPVPREQLGELALYVPRSVNCWSAGSASAYLPHCWRFGPMRRTGGYGFGRAAPRSERRRSSVWNAAQQQQRWSNCSTPTPRQAQPPCAVPVCEDDASITQDHRERPATPPPVEPG